jgi:hypothetical protein
MRGKGFQGVLGEGRGRGAVRPDSRVLLAADAAVRALRADDPDCDPYGHYLLVWALRQGRLIEECPVTDEGTKAVVRRLSTRSGPVHAAVSRTTRRAYELTLVIATRQADAFVGLQLDATTEAGRFGVRRREWSD